MTTLSLEAVADAAYIAGFRGEALVTAVAVSCAEVTSHDPDAHNDNPSTGDDSWGLWQINYYGSLRPGRTKQFGPPEGLRDPVANARAAYAISGGGNSFTPWSTYKAGSHKQYLDAARTAANTVSARGGTPLTSTTTTSSSTAGSLSPDVTPAGAPGELSARFAPAHGNEYLVFGVAGVDQADRILSGTVELTAAEISEISVALNDDENLSFIGSGQIGLGSLAQLGEVALVVAEYETAQGPATPQMRLKIRSRGGQAMKLNRGPLDIFTGSPTEFMAARAAANGLAFVGQGSARRPQIARTYVPGVPDQQESDWDVGKRLAGEVGYWMFESAGTLYFGRPTWLVNHLVTVKVGWNLGWDDEAFDAEEMPNCKRGFDAMVTIAAAPPVGFVATNQGDQEVSALGTGRMFGQSVRQSAISFKLPRWRGERVRAGMKAVLAGVPGFAGAYIITKVTWPLDGGLEMVSVDALEPLDPLPLLPQSTDTTSEPPPATTATVGAPPAHPLTGWEGIDQAVTMLGLRMGAPTVGQTTGGSHVSNSEHYQGRARDYGNAASDDSGIAKAMVAYATGANAPVDELFHQPTGNFWKNGSRITPSQALSDQHRDHCHVGVRAGVALANYIAPAKLPGTKDVAV